MKENLKPCVYKLSRALYAPTAYFVERSGELCILARLRDKVGAAGKPSLNRANESVCADPKPGDLSMSRLKLP